MNSVAATTTAEQQTHARTTARSAADRTIKRRRVLDILAGAGADSLLLTSQTSLAWYLDGSRVHVGLAGDPIAAMLVDHSGDHLVTFNNESARLSAEEIPDGVARYEIPWYGGLTDVGSWYRPDAAPLPEQAVSRQLRDARRALLPGEAERYARLNADAAAALTDVLATARPDTSELQVAAALSERVVAAGAEPLVLLCSGAQRTEYRHPLPTSAPLGRRAMTVLCARRDGMIANVTRWVRFDAGTPRELDAEARIAAVEAEIFAATVPGARLSEVFTRIKAAYERHGFGPEQWRLHHQGGPAGYAGRDPRATESADDVVQVNGAFTWNPSGPGVKIEDTVLLTETGVQVLSVDRRWPTTAVAGLARAATLRL